MDERYYREYRELERTHWWFVARGEILMAHLRRCCAARTPMRILNVGAATGRTSELLGEFGDVHSVEYDAACARVARACGQTRMHRASILDLPYRDRTFDLVCAFDVLEHVEDDRRAAAELRRVCAPGGFICVTVPAFMFLWSHHDAVNHHVRRYRRGQLAGLFAGRLEPVHLTYFNTWLFVPIAVFRLLSLLRPGRPHGRTDAGSDFFAARSPRLDRALYRVFRSERFFVARRIALPAGVSLLGTWRRPAC